MKCINSQFMAMNPNMNPLFAQRTQIQHKETLWLTNKPSGEVLAEQNIKFSSVSCVIRTKALPPSSSIFLAATATPGNVSGLLKVSAILLFLYWIANFVVPEFLLKDLQSHIDADQNPSEENRGDKPDGTT